MSEASGSTQREGSKGSKDSITGKTSKLNAKILAEIARHLDDPDVISLMQVSHFTKESVDLKQRPRYKEYNALIPKLFQIAYTTNFKERDALFQALPPVKYFQSAVKELKWLVDAPSTYSMDFADAFNPQNYIHFIMIIALKNVLEIRLKLEKGKIQGYPFSQYFKEADGFNIEGDEGYVNKLVYPKIHIRGFQWSFATVLNHLYPAGLRLQRKMDEWMTTFSDNQAHPGYKHARVVQALVVKINRLIHLLIHNRFNIMLHQSETDVMNEFMFFNDDIYSLPEEVQSLIIQSRRDSTINLYMELFDHWYYNAPKHYIPLMKKALLHRNTLRIWVNENQKTITKERIIRMFEDLGSRRGGRVGVKKSAKKAKAV